MVVHYKGIVSYLRANYFYDSETGVIRNIHDRSIATKLDKGFKVLRLDRRNIFSQNVAWLLHTGHWPSNFICRLDDNEENDRITNLVDISWNTIQERKSYMIGYVIERRHGFEAYYLRSMGATEDRKYLGRYYTKQDAWYRVYADNVERKRKDRSVFAHLERNTRASV